MLYALIALIAILAGSSWLLMRDGKVIRDKYGFVDTKELPTIVVVMCIFAIGGSVIGLGFIAVFGINYHGAQYKANIINREYGTNYTQQEVFYADSVIDTIRELDRKRVEVNGDVFRDAERNLGNK